MGHVQDRWYSNRPDPSTGRQVRTKTALHGTGQRYKVRYVDLDGAERSKSFPDRCKRAADNFLLEIETSKREGRFVSPHAGKLTFRAHAENWFKGQSTDRGTRTALRSRLESRIYPHFGHRPLDSIKPATVREWLGNLDDAKYSQNYRTVLFTIVSSVLDSAVEDNLIVGNPCKAQTIKRPKSSASNIIVWTGDRLDAVEKGLNDRFSVVSTLGAGCGLRQGEILGLSSEDIDQAGMVVHVRRQIRIIDRQLVFSLPKGGKTRKVPLARGVLNRITQHLDSHPPIDVQLPWAEPAGELVDVALLVTGEHGRLYSGDLFNKVVWKPAFSAAGLTYRKRADGMHALRHFYASVLLAQGVSIKELADYLGHADPGFTLRTYTHLVPSSFERARAAVDDVFAPLSVPTGDGLTAA